MNSVFERYFSKNCLLKICGKFLYCRVTKFVTRLNIVMSGGNSAEIINMDKKKLFVIHYKCLVYVIGSQKICFSVG